MVAQFKRLKRLKTLFN